jgi:hypothetical protein
MSAALKGVVYAMNRSQMIRIARAKAAAYFETDCVAIKLENERPHSLLEGFNADFTGIVWHEVETPIYGPGKCRKCDREDWPHRRLNPITKEEWL